MTYGVIRITHDCQIAMKYFDTKILSGDDLCTLIHSDCNKISIYAPPMLYEFLDISNKELQPLVLISEESKNFEISKNTNPISSFFLSSEDWRFGLNGTALITGYDRLNRQMTGLGMDEETLRIYLKLRNMCETSRDVEKKVREYLEKNSKKI